MFLPSRLTSRVISGSGNPVPPWPDDTNVHWAWINRLLPPAQAHKIEVSGDVAGVWHLEPNHSPRAGEPALVWIALTQAGGRVIPLEECDCRLRVYAGRTIGTTPLPEPVLEPIAAEHYQGIPGATVVFPQVGAYFLHLEGRPQAGANFQPFAISYTVTVAAGRSPQSSPAAPVSAPGTVPASPVVSPPLSFPWVGTIGLGLVVLLGVGLYLGRHRQGHPPQS